MIYSEFIYNFGRHKTLTMKKILLPFLILLAAACQKAYPEVIHIEGDRMHVQGIVLDCKADCMYSSFTSSFLKTDLEGNITGSVTGINGHLGDIAFDASRRKVYASLEVKDDAIGRGISKALGASEHSREQSCFHIAEINVDKLTSLNMPFDEVAKTYTIDEAAKDYMGKVTLDDKEVEHRYGCSGIDGIAIGPAFGSGSSKADHLYVAYGIYGDTARKDNDYNIILCYRLDDLTTPIHKFFVHTGNTTYGVQNMAYDKASRKMYLAVYKGKKPQYPNYDLFALDIDQTPYQAPLKDVPYQNGDVVQLDVCKGWHFKWGSTGLCPLGDGHWYISENSKKDGVEICNARLYSLSENGDSPFISYGTEE